MEDPKLDAMLKLDFEPELSDAERAELNVLDQLAQQEPQGLFSDFEQRHARLLDIQARHARELEQSDVLWRANIVAAEVNLDAPQGPVFDDHGIYRACVFRLRGRQGPASIEQAGVRFISSYYVEVALGSGMVTAIRHNTFNVPVYTSLGPERRLHTFFSEEHADVVASLLPELEAVRESLMLSTDLTSVRPPAQPK